MTKRINVNANTNNSLEAENRIEHLNKNISYNEKEITNIKMNISEKELNKIENHFNRNLIELESLEEYINDSSDNVLKQNINQLGIKYRSLQNSFINKKMAIINEKINKLDGRMDCSIENLKKKTDSLTGDLLFSVIAIFLGISLVSAMITGIEKVGVENLMVYFVSIAWLAIIIIGFSYLLIKEFDKKSRSILVVIIIMSIILSFILYLTYISPKV